MVVYGRRAVYLAATIVDAVGSCKAQSHGMVEAEKAVAKVRSWGATDSRESFRLEKAALMRPA